MTNKNININERMGCSAHNSSNELRLTFAHLKNRTRCRGFATLCLRRSGEKASFFFAHYPRHFSRETNSYRRIAGWSFGLFTILGLFSYLTFIPEQASAAYDWETRTLSDITTMQDMNAKICENSEIGETKQLEDTREPGKKYWITKLKGDTAGTKANGKCWMTQNLDYDISDSEVTGIRKITNLSEWTSGGITNTGVAYYDPGDYYYTAHTWDSSGCSSASGLSACTGTGTGKGFSTSVSNETEKHYHVGNYYSWDAATKGTSKSLDSGEAPDSICPTNWRLPTSGDNTGEFRNLMLAYGWTTDNPNNIALNMNSSKGIFGDPLYFVYGGYLLSGQLSYAGYGGVYWSSTPHSNGTSAYLLSFGSGVNPSASDTRYYGFSVRCVARDDVYPEQPPIDDNSQANVAITVSPVISIDVTQHVDTQVDFTRVAQSEIRARVGSNQPYQVLLSTEKSALTNDDIEQNIPMIPSDQKIVAGTSSWGIKKLTNASDTEVDADTIYSPVGINGNKALFYTSNTAASEDLIFPIAIAVNQQLPQGTYSTQVTLTAVAM